MKLADVDWVPGTRFWHRGEWHVRPAHATFKSDIGRIKVTLWPDGIAVHTGYGRDAKPLDRRIRFRRSSKFRVHSRSELETILYYTNAVQNKRRKKEVSP